MFDTAVRCECRCKCAAMTANDQFFRPLCLECASKAWWDDRHGDAYDATP